MKKYLFNFDALAKAFFCLTWLLLLFFHNVYAKESFTKRALVTGGAGFIGSHLCERMINEGYCVICLDNLYTGHRENISHLLKHPRFKFVEHDVVDPYDPQMDVDEIYNLACPASPIHYQQNPIHTLLTSIHGAQHCLELAKKYNASIFQASTSEVYGDPLEHPQNESYWGHVNPIGIRACYDEGKRAAETLFFDYHRCYKVKIKVARIFNTYGPRMSKEDGRVVSNFIVQALQCQPLTMYGDGRQTRSFCYVDDLIEGIRKFMNSPDDFVGPVNLGNPKECSMGELAELVIAITHSSSEIRWLPLPADDPRKRLPDIRSAKTKLHWEPKISLHECLKKTIEYFETANASSTGVQCKDLRLKTRFTPEF